MSQKYDWPDKIPDEAIRDEFARVDTVQFSARRSNHIKYRSIGIGELGWWLPLLHVLPIIGITPQMLRPVFNRQWHHTDMGWQLSELPEIIEDYDQLGCFPLCEEHFVAFAKVLGKSVEVLREDGGSGEHYRLFTVTASGERLQPA